MHQSVKRNDDFDGQRALVVEPDRASGELLYSQLRDLGLSVDLVTAGVDAVVATRRYTPAIVFIDLQLGDVSGIELVSWLRANPALAAVPIVAIHALAERLPALASGFRAFIKKPITRGAVSDVVRDVLRHTAQ